MPGKQAKVLSKDDLQDLLVYASATRNPIRNRVIVLLSAKAGLRAGEIANLTWDMILEPNGAISTAIELRDHAAKKRSGRVDPVAQRSAECAGELARRYIWDWPDRTLRARLCDDPAEHRRVVCTGISSRRP
jgi:integrase